MPDVRSYNDMHIDLLQATPQPNAMVGLAIDITMRNSPNTSGLLTPALAKFLVEAEHTSVFEHVVFTFLLTGISRSFLAQITRQRMASPTSGSQHYQDYRDYPCSVHPSVKDNQKVKAILDESFSAYTDLVDKDKLAPEEARQVLPNAACVTYLWTINARSLMVFLRQRCCNRNVAEMRIFSTKILTLARSVFPALFDLVGPQCFMDGVCKQGRMQCKTKTWVMI